MGDDKITVKKFGTYTWKKDGSVEFVLYNGTLKEKITDFFEAMFFPLPMDVPSYFIPLFIFVVLHIYCVALNHFFVGFVLLAIGLANHARCMFRVWC